MLNLASGLSFNTNRREKEPIELCTAEGEFKSIRGDYQTDLLDKLSLVQGLKCG